MNCLGEIDCDVPSQSALVFQPRGILMNPNVKVLQLRGILVWVTGLMALLLIGSIIPDWLINFFLWIIILAFLAPIVGIFGLRWWLQRSMITGDCPVCSAPLQMLNVQQTELTCPHCGTPLQVQQGKFVRLTPPGVVDVAVIEVSAQIEE